MALEHSPYYKNISVMSKAHLKILSSYAESRNVLGGFKCLSRDVHIY